MANMVSWFMFDSTNYDWSRSIFIDCDCLRSISIDCDSPM